MASNPYAEFDPLDHNTPIEDREAVRRLSLATIGRRPQVLEVGSWAGQTAIYLADHGCDVYCVDHWRGNVDDRLGQIASELPEDEPFRAFCRNAAWRLFSTIFPCRGDSLLWASVWNRSMDLVFIDAGHDYDSVKADIAAWAPHVRAGGILCGHDYAKEFPGVVQAVDEVGKQGLVGRAVWWKRM